MDVKLWTAVSELNTEVQVKFLNQQQHQQQQHHVIKRDKKCVILKKDEFSLKG